MKKYLWIISFLLISCNRSTNKELPVINSNDSISNNTTPAIVNFLNHFESLFRTNMNLSGSPGAAMVIVKDSNVLLMNTYGIKELDKPDSITLKSMFRIASLSKGFTGVLSSICIEKGYFALEDPVVKYIPEFKLSDTAQTRRIKIKHLLSHSTGLPNHTLGEMIEDGKTIDDMLKKLRKIRLVGEEGKVFEYQNLTIGLMDKIFKSTTGKNFNELIQTEIFDKAGMNSSTTYQDLINYDDKAMPHDESNHKYKVRQIHDKYYNVAAAGGINANIEDMSKWLLVLLGNRQDIANEKVLDRVFTPIIEMNAGQDEGTVGYFDAWDGVQHSYYGMGWRILDYGNKRIYHHGGNVNSFRSEIAIDRKNKIGICVLFNAPCNFSMTIIPTFFNYYDFYLSMQTES